MKLLNILAITLLTFQLTQAQEKKAPMPMESFSPFVGTWHAPDSVLKKNPQMQGRAIFKFQPDAKNTHMVILEDFSLTDKGDYAFMAILSSNPLTGMFEFMGVNTQRGFLFKGQYTNLSDKGFTREYDVSYPLGGQMAKSFGQVVSFKEEFKLRDANTLVFDIKYYNKATRQWEDWSSGEHIVIRKG